MAENAHGESQPEDTQQRTTPNPSELVIYFDWCVIDAMRKGEYPDVVDAIAYARSIIRVCIPYSSIHITEATRVFLEPVKREAMITENLGYLSKLSENWRIYANPDQEAPRLRLEDPRNLAEIFAEDGAAESVLGSVLTDDGSPGVAQLRELMDLKPRDLNNISVDKILDAIDEKLGLFDRRMRETDPQYLAEVETRSLQPKLDSWVNAAKVASGANGGMSQGESVMMLYFLLIDLLGYHSDIRMDEQFADKMFNVARDARHAHHASYCNFFVTRDGRLIKKAQAVYRRLGRCAPVLHINNFAQQLRAIADVLAAGRTS